MRLSRLTLALPLATLCAACAATPIPQERLTASQAAIRGAEEVGAADVARAALHLRFAQEQVAEAKHLIANGDNERASLVLMRAQADAELSLALAREEATRAEAQEAVDEAAALRRSSL